VLQAGVPEAEGNRAVIGAGTGLGQAMLVRQGDHYQVCASEGGHVDFAPRDTQQVALLQYLLNELGQVSVEHLLSGPGLYRLYRFLRDSGAARESTSLADALAGPDAAAVISQHAADDALCREALRLFCRIYGAHAANVGLASLASGGIYLTGGVTRRVMQYLADGELLAAFRQHLTMPALLQHMPLQAVTYDNPGLLGAALYAADKIKT
jgi:glucokinase